MTFGSGEYRYELVEGWDKLPKGWKWGWIPAVACDSQDRVFVNSRSEHPLVIFDREGNFLESWGGDILKDAHGIFIDKEDNVYCTEWETHCVYKFSSSGELLMTLGTPGQPGLEDGKVFRKPTDLAVASTGDIFVSDGYGNARVHKYSPNGTLLKSWGEWGAGPGQFELSHCVRIDKDDRVWVCDRTNNRIQIFNLEGEFMTQWENLLHPDTIFFDPTEDVVYIAEMDQQVSIYTMEGELITKWGGAQKSKKPGEFSGFPHGIWADSLGDLYVGQVQVDAGLQKFARVR